MSTLIEDLCESHRRTIYFQYVVENGLNSEYKLTAAPVLYISIMYAEGVQGMMGDKPLNTLEIWQRGIMNKGRGVHFITYDQSLITYDHSMPGVCLEYVRGVPRGVGGLHIGAFHLQFFSKKF